MNTIILVYLPNLTEEQKTELLSRSKVGKAEWVQSGDLIIYSRIRNITVTDIDEMGLNKWEFPARVEDEQTPSYNARVKVEALTSFNKMKTGLYDCIFVSEVGFQNLSKQLEFINS